MAVLLCKQSTIHRIFKEGTKVTPTITVMRHGPALYAQEKVSLSDARDLTPQGVEEVAAAAQELATRIPLTATVRMWSSPFARTLQTAKIVHEELAKQHHAFALKNAEKDVSAENVIRSLHRFDEVRNFDLQLFLSFLNGGEVTGFGDDLAMLDKTTTNPNGLSFVEYFNARAWESITGIPQEVMDAMHAIEQLADTRKRLIRTLDRLTTLPLSQKTHIVLITHLGLMEGVVSDVVNPADFFTVSL